MRMYLLTIQSILVVIQLIFQGVYSFRWLGINSTKVDESNETNLRRYLCPSGRKGRGNRLLDSTQIKICKKRIKFMKYVVAAAELAKKECLRLMKYERWDCTGILKAPKFSKDLRVGTKEAGFLQALSSAALVFSITQNCATDRTCECGKNPRVSLLRPLKKKKPKKSYKYAGCHDNILFGVKFSKAFLDRGEPSKHKNKPERSLVHLHNNDLGRKVVEDNMNITCNCWGFQCVTEECFYRLIVPFSKIAGDLFNRYKKSHLVVAAPHKGNRRKTIPYVLKNSGVENKKKRKKPNAYRMVYLYKSRDFCFPDSSGNGGVKGRVCAQRLRSSRPKLREYNPNMPDSVNVCGHLCCGRGHTSIIFITQKYCDCRFSYSRMKLVCTKCPVVEQKSICK